MIYSRICGTGSYLPARIMTNAEFAARLDTSDAWIRERTGIVQRHIADNTQTSSDLALEASNQALQAAGVPAQEIDLIIVATSTPDYVFPSTACLLQAKLGVKGSTAFDLQAVCSGFVYGIATADAFIKSGRHKKALVVGAEVFSRILDWNDRGTCVLFGDGAGAVVLAAGANPGIHASVLRADGSHADMLSVPGNVCGGAVAGSPFLQMNGQAVFKFAVKVLEESARE
ncbi:MAG TPA: beta-ketoacyl-ACP synthase 3, partial [Burkholderiales bacterium]|nr:beta-ketoacyl-ACP synthase 3 [Burkholderiales bacterium]